MALEEELDEALIPNDIRISIMACPKCKAAHQIRTIPSEGFSSILQCGACGFEWTDFKIKCEKLLEQTPNKKLMTLLLDICDNIYHAVCVVPQTFNLENWDPYKGHRDMQKSGIVALFWWFDLEMTQELAAGTLIYSGEKPVPGEEQPIPGAEDSLPDTDVFADVINTEVGEETEGEFASIPAKIQPIVLDRLQKALSRQPVDAWDGAPRIDES